MSRATGREILKTEPMWLPFFSDTVRKKGVLAKGQNTTKVWITELNGAQQS